MKLSDSDYRIIALLCVIILHAYLLVYANTPLSIDGSDTLDVAATLVQHGTPAATRLVTARQLIVGNDETEFYTLSPDGERYSKKGIVPSIALLPFLFLSQWIPILSPRASAMLFNPLVTMLTALQLFVFARRLKASSLIAMMLALIFSFASISIVYVKTLFGEPLAALLLLLAVYHSYIYIQDRKVWHLALAGISIGLSIGVNYSYVVLTIPLGFYILSASRDRAVIISYGLPILAIILFLAYWNMIRFGSPFATGYELENNVEGFTTPLWYGITGLWISFYKGVLWFQPVLWLGFLGLPYFYRKHRALLFLSIAVISIHTLIYATWWAWDGAWSWGGRFMLPILPLLFLPILSVLELSLRKWFIRSILILLTSISVSLQIPGVLYSYIPFYQTVYDGQLFHWQNHIALAAFAGLFELSFEPAVLSEGIDIIQLIIICFGFTVGSVAIYLLRGKIRTLIIVIVLIISCFATVARQESKASYEFVREWEQKLGNSGTAYIQSFQFDTRLLDIDGMRLIVTNPHAPQENPLVQKQWEHVQSLNTRFWLVTWFPPANPENWVEHNLWQEYPFVEEQSIAGHRALQFSMTKPAEINCTTDVLIDSAITLNGYGTKFDENGLYVSLRWHANNKPTKNYSWFVHLLDAEGNIVLQQDREPQGGYMPTSTWQINKSVDDYLLFPVTDDSNITAWRLRIGYVDVSTGELQPMQSVEGQQLETAYVTLPLNCGA